MSSDGGVRRPLRSRAAPPGLGFLECCKISRVGIEDDEPMGDGGNWYARGASCLEAPGYMSDGGRSGAWGFVVYRVTTVRDRSQMWAEVRRCFFVLAGVVFELRARLARWDRILSGTLFAWLHSSRSGGQRHVQNDGPVNKSKAASGWSTEDEERLFVLHLTGSMTRKVRSG